MRANPERFALNVLLAAFTVFLLICGGILYGVQWFIFQSQVPMDVTLSVNRGTVSVVPPDTGEAIAVTDVRNDVEPGARITTDSASQGLLSFRDPHTDRLVAEWVLHHDTDVTLESALAPRFGLNPRQYAITGTSRDGNSETRLLTATSRPAGFTISTEQATAFFGRAGHYLLDVSNGETRVTTRQGLAEVTNETNRVVSLDPDERVTVTSPGEQPRIEDAEHDLLDNGNFRLPDMAGWEPYTLGTEPTGMASSIIFEGRPVVLLDRSSDLFGNIEFDHGEIGLEQIFDPRPSDMTYLEVRATFRVEEQSLSTCGIAGSECPLMLRIDFRDQDGDRREWVHGFYVTHNPGLELPLRCDTCPIEHERVAPDRWYTYESGNLMTLLPETQKPEAIIGFRFYASGHAFSVYVAEMSLLSAP